ncbi:MAG: hypothetical protein IT435_00855 [Phycisphaerales bacterium]|nr:hypothetical protein [Phycisphaerales bacterium]
MASDQGDSAGSEPLSGLDVTEGGGAGRGSGGRQGDRPFLRVFFRCANQYLRVYRTVDGTGYRAICPLCRKRMNFIVGPGGTSERFFEVSC